MSVVTSILLSILLPATPAPGSSPDGVVVPPREYSGSLEESAQEAIILFQGSRIAGEAEEDLILKITVEGDAAEFAWVIPFPREPKVHAADAELFHELFDYVEARIQQRQKAARSKGKEQLGAAAEAEQDVEVLSRRVVGSYDVAVVREHERGALGDWLEENGYRRLENADDVLDFYREKDYVFACLKVTDAALEAGEEVDLHPLRFHFRTGGRDGIYFPMKMTGLQSRPFDVNLYVFYRYWLNDRLSKYGYLHRGFQLRHRDWDTSDCIPNGGKRWTDPRRDAYLRDMADRIPKVTRLLQALQPGARFYLTNIQARDLDPQLVRAWSDDLWLFPYYTDRNMVPHDARPGGPAARGWESAGR